MRGFEHLRGFINKNPNNVMYKHKQSDHKNGEMVMKMVIINTFQDALTRHSNEVVRISRRKNSKHSKCEMNHPPIAHITTVEKKQQ